MSNITRKTRTHYSNASQPKSRNSEVNADEPNELIAQFGSFELDIEPFPGAEIIDWPNTLQRELAEQTQDETPQTPKKRKRRLSDARAHLAASEFNGRIRRNELSGRVELWPGAPVDVDQERDWDDVLTTRLRYFFERTYKGAQPTATDVNNLVEEFAAANAYDPLIDWVRALKWDGISRLDTWLVDYLGATQDLAYLRAVGRSVMISAVGRALEPGCKVDTMMVLSGGQGVSKSDACQALAPWPELFSPSLPNIYSGDKDAEIQLGQISIQEIADLAVFRRADTETLKAFITRASSRVRPPYARHAIEIKRRSIFIGTTNPSDYLTDTTGNRRFLPVTTTKAALDELRRDKHQLWAEAAEAYRDGETWVIEQKGIDKALEAERDAVLDKDVWTSTIEEGLRKRPVIKNIGDGDFVTINDVLKDIISIPPKDHGKREQGRVSDVLRYLGWTKGNRCRIDGTRVYPWYPPVNWDD